MSVELFKVKICSKTSKGFEFLKLTAKPYKVLKILKKSRGKSHGKSWNLKSSKEYEPCVSYLLKHLTGNIRSNAIRRFDMSYIIIKNKNSC